jgi:hypothetical protein
METVIGLLAGIPFGFVLGICAVKLWPGRVAADYVTLKSEFDKIAKFVHEPITAAHNKLDGLHAKLDAIAEKVGIKI